MAPLTSPPCLRAAARFFRSSLGSWGSQKMLGMAPSSITVRAGVLARMEAVKSGPVVFQVELDHHVLGDLTPFEGPVLKPPQSVFLFGNPALQARRQGFVLQGGP